MGAAPHIIGTILVPLKTRFGCDLVKLSRPVECVEGGGPGPGASPDEAAAVTRA